MTTPPPGNIAAERCGRFACLFDGRRDAYGTGEGRWVRQPPTLQTYADHLNGKGPGLGIAPLLDSGMVRFAVIDLDEPDFEFAATLQEFLPGKSYVERSRSGNAHVWVFFKGLVEGWVPRGVMLKALEALGRKNVEVNPKQDRLPAGGLGNYINLPYYGDTRPILWDPAEGDNATPMTLGSFLNDAYSFLLDPEDWRRRARALGVESPEERPDTAEFGTRDVPHDCAMYIYERRETHPIQPGSRAVVLFSLAKQWLNWKAITADRALELMNEVNEASPWPVPAGEVRRIRDTVIKGQYTSTGCSDPLMADYVRPDCPIAREA